MTDKIVSLFTGQSTSTPNGELVACLTDMLARATAGELQSMAFAGEWADGTVVTGLTDSAKSLAVLGALRVVEYELLRGIEV